MLLIAQHPDQRDYIQPEFSMRHRPPALLLRSRRLMEARTGGVTAAIHFQGELRDPLQCGDGPLAMACHPHSIATSLTGGLKRF
jgi:hypothetical protein